MDAVAVGKENCVNNDIGPHRADDQRSVDCNHVDKSEDKKSSPASKKENGKSKKKSDKGIDHVLKALQSLNTPEEKLAALCKKYADLLDEHRTLQTSLRHSESRCLHVQRERDQIQMEHSKAILTRSRLESLCRELQKQNKVVQEESLLKVKEEEEKTREVSQKFQTTLGEIHNLMEASNQKNSKLRDENMELGQKLKSLVEQCELREQHIDQMVKHKELEAQLAEAKLAKVTMQLTEEKEQYLVEKKKLLHDLTDYQKRCHELASNEIQLRTQLGLYTEKYEEFQSTLNKSNEVFHSFKGEMDKMSKKIKKLENETSSWKSRWENSNRAMLEMAEDKQRRDTVYQQSQKRIVQLEKLCRALQTERVSLQQQLKIQAPDRPDAEATGDSEMCESKDTEGENGSDEGLHETSTLASLCTASLSSIMNNTDAALHPNPTPPYNPAAEQPQLPTNPSKDDQSTPQSQGVTKDAH